MKTRMTVYQLTVTALIAAVLCVVGPMSVPIGVIPITLATLILYLAAYLLGWKGAVCSTLIYLLIGAAGLPVFSGYTGGLVKLMGPTGGFLVGYLFVSLLGGLVSEATCGNLFWTPIGLIVATAVLYGLGSLWYCWLTGNTIMQAYLVCVQPFILIDLGKIAIATILGKPIRIALTKAGLMKESAGKRAKRREKAEQALTEKKKAPVDKNPETTSETPVEAPEEKKES